MKTPQQIIDALPEGNRKRAARLSYALSGKIDDPTDPFWVRMGAGEYDEAAKMMADEDDPDHECNILADMIWEG